MSIQAIQSSPPVPSPSKSPPAQASAQRAPEPAATVAIQRDQIELVVQQLRRVVEPVARNLLFSVDQQTGKTVVRVVDAQSNEVIRQIPSEEMMAIAQALDKLEGLLLNQKA